jgi:esterase/lipase superfamily enzyme
MNHNFPQIQLVFFFYIISFFINCGKPIGQLINERIVEPYEDTKLVNVHYVTTRRELTNSENCDANSYGFITHVNAHFGTCLVSVPSKRVIGDISVDNRADKSVFFQLKGRLNSQEQEFYQKLKTSRAEEILIFVHGFNVNFDEAAIRAAQIKYDLKFPGEVVLYSWPAGSEGNFLGQVMVKSVYESNFTEAKLNRTPFVQFLKTMRTLGKKIHLIVHSMGHQVVLPSLSTLSAEGGKPWISELILNAPDFDRSEFSLYLPGLIGISQRITLYCSPGDNALLASQKINGSQRAGMCFKYAGVDVINVNEVDSPVFGVGGLGHGYYSSRPILTDIFQVLLGVSVERRLFIRKSGANNGENWVLRK